MPEATGSQLWTEDSINLDADLCRHGLSDSTDVETVDVEIDKVGKQKTSLYAYYCHDHHNYGLHEVVEKL